MKTDTLILLALAGFAVWYFTTQQRTTKALTTDQAARKVFVA